MLNLQEVANFLNDKLNEIGNAQNPVYNFRIMAEVGKNTNDGYVNGIVKAKPASMTPRANYVNVKFDFKVEFPIQTGEGNYNVLNINNIINLFAEQYNNTEYAFTGGKGGITCILSDTGDYKNAYGTGSGVPLGFGLLINYTESAVTSINKHWLLNDVEIPFIKESVSVEKDGRINEIASKQYTEVLITKQTRYYTFTFPFDTSNTLCSNLNKDILDGNYDKSYTLKYYDGTSYTQTNPFTTKVSIFKSGNSSSENPNTAQFMVTFSDIHTPVETTQYYIGLCNFDYDIGSEDTLYFEDTTAQKRYFDTLVSASGVGSAYVSILSPNLNSIFMTSQIYHISNVQLPVISPLNTIDYANKNYAVIQVTSGSFTRYYYYYVTKSAIGTDDQIVLDLQMDTVQTYFFNSSVTFDNAFIEKAHLDRFIDNGDGTVSFNGGVDSPLFEREEIQNVAKRMTKRTVLNYEPDTANNSPLNEWIKDNISGWKYYFLTDNTYTFYGLSGTSTITGNFDIPDFKTYDVNSSYGFYNITGIMPVLVVPIYKNTSLPYNNHIKLFYTSDGVRQNILIDELGMDGFRTLNNDNSNIFSVKISKTPPLPVQLFHQDTYERYLIDDSNNLCIGTIYDEPDFGTSYCTGVRTTVNSSGLGNYIGYGAISLRDQSISNIYPLEDYTISHDITFAKTDIIGADKNVIFNPKLLSSDYASLKLTNERGNGFDYDIQKLNQKTITSIVSEAITPDVSRIYHRINNTDGIYIDECSQNLTGFVDSADLSLMVDNDQLSAMLANNKNYFMQSNLNIGTGLVGGLVGGGLIGGPIGALGGAVAGAIGGIINNALTVDNMKNAPKDVKNANGNAYFNVAYTTMGPTIEEYDILQNEKEIINDQMFQNGFVYNRLGDVKDFVNTRKYFNYVKAQIGTIKSLVNISNDIRNNLRARFSQGIRFWDYSVNYGTVQYIKENYEKWLEEE